MSDIITGVRQLIQDLVSPDLKAHAVKLETLQRQGEMAQKQSEVQYDSLMKHMDAFRAEMRSEFTSLRANNQLEVLRQVAPSVSGLQSSSLASSKADAFQHLMNCL